MNKLQLKLEEKLLIKFKQDIFIEDYNQYYFTYKEYIYNLSIGIVVFWGIAYLFYESIIGIIIFTPFSFLYIKSKRKELLEERKWKLNTEFREGIISIAAALHTGYSIENAFNEAMKDIEILYTKDCMIYREFNYINYQLGMNVTLEDALEDLAARSKIEDIKVFTEVFITAKRTGGDIIKVIRAASKTIGDKVEIKKEIITLIAAKKFEQKIMNMIPFGIIVYLKLSSPVLLEGLYGNVTGIIIMTSCLLLYYFAYRLSKKIVDIEL